MRRNSAVGVCFAIVWMTGVGVQAAGQPASAGAGVMISASAAPDPVRWRVAAAEPVTVRPGELRATVMAEVAPGWHLYALDEPADGPVPLEFSAAPDGAVALMSVGAERPLRGTVRGFAEPVAFYAGRVGFRLRMRMLRGGMQDVGKVKLQALYQACNERLCLPPRVALLTLPLHEPRGVERVR